MYESALKRFEGYKEAQISAVSDQFHSGITTNAYDVNGNLIGVDDSTKSTRDRSFVNDVAGHALYVNQAGNEERQIVVNGEVLGRHGRGINEVTPNNTSGDPNFTQVADFDFSYQRITGHFPGPGVGSYTTRAGDTLRSIARAAYGDEKQWFRIAQSNGLSGEHDLRVGQTITIPSSAGGQANNADTYRPYDSSRMVGDTSPYLSPVPGDAKGCGILGTIIVIVVTVVIAYYAGAAAAELGYSTMMAAAIGGAAGSVAGQVASMAMGMQDDLSWKSVALAAVGGAVTAGLGSVSGLSGTGAIATAARAAISNAVTQRFAIAVGLQETPFSWRGVAASAVGAAVGQALTDSIMGTELQGPTQSGRGIVGREGGMVGAMGGGAAAKIAGSALLGFASGMARTAASGGRVSVKQVAVDAFGNALGSSLAGAMGSHGQTQGEGPWSDKNYLNEMDRQDDAAVREADRAWRADQDRFYDETGIIPGGGVDEDHPAQRQDSSKPRSLAFKPQLQKNPVTGRSGFDQGNDVWSFPVSDGRLGLPDDLTNMTWAGAPGDLSYSNAEARRLSNYPASLPEARSDWNVGTRVLGGVQALGGAAGAVGGSAAIVAGAALAPETLGFSLLLSSAGYVGLGASADQFAAGVHTMLSGEHQRTYTGNFIEWGTGVSPQTAEFAAGMLTLSAAGAEAAVFNQGTRALNSANVAARVTYEIAPLATTEMGGLQAIGVNNFSAIYGKAPAAKVEIDALSDEVAGIFGGRVAKAPIKSQERALEKIMNDYGGDATRIKDLARNTIIVGPEKIDLVAAQLASRGANIKIINGAVDPLGYSGVNSTIKTQAGIFGEVQVNSPAMIYAKEPESLARALLGDPVYNSVATRSGIPGGLGHGFYEQWRVLSPNSPAASSIAEQSRAYYEAIRRANGH